MELGWEGGSIGQPWAQEKCQWVGGGVLGYGLVPHHPRERWRWEG